METLLDNLANKDISEMSSEELEKEINKASQAKDPVAPAVEAPKEVKEEPKTEEKPVEEKKEEAKQDELILGKFKTIEELEKSYKEAEKKISRQGEELSEIRRSLQEVQSKPQVQQPTPEDQLAGLRPYMPEFTDSQIQSVLGLTGMMTKAALDNYKREQEALLTPLMELKHEREITRQRDAVKSKYKDLYNDYEAELEEKLQRLPSDLKAKDGGVETVFLTVLGEHVSDIRDKARGDAQKEVVVKTKKADDAFVEGGGHSTMPTPPVDPNSMSSDELEKYINQLRKRR